MAERAYFPADLENCRRAAERDDRDVSWGRIEHALKEGDEAKKALDRIAGWIEAEDDPKDLRLMDIRDLARKILAGGKVA